MPLTGSLSSWMRTKACSRIEDNGARSIRSCRHGGKPRCGGWLAGFRTRGHAALGVAGLYFAEVM
jgi:hypothetical protein